MHGLPCMAAVVILIKKSTETQCSGLPTGPVLTNNETVQTIPTVYIQKCNIIFVAQKYNHAFLELSIEATVSATTKMNAIFCASLSVLTS